MSHLDRRDFIAASLGAAAAYGAPSTARAAESSPNEQLNFALIGSGDQGLRDAGMLLKNPGVQMTAVCEINPLNVQRAKQLSPRAKLYENWEELLSSEKDLDAVIVALPEHTHAAASIASLQAGKHVFCEKPMAYTLDQTRAMIAARDHSKKTLQIGQQRRSNPIYYLAERLIRKEGLLGEVVRVDAFWDRSGDWKRPLPTLDKDFSSWGFPTLDHLVNWRLYRKYGHGLMTENGTHQMDAASWLLGDSRPTTVCGLGAVAYRDERETFDLCTAEYLFENDVIVRFSQDFHQGFNYQWSYGELFLGNEGALRITAEQELVHYDRSRKARRIPVSRLGGDLQIAGVNCTQDEMRQHEQDRAGGALRTFSYFNEMRIFAHCVRNNTTPSCTAEIGHNSIAYTIMGAQAQYDQEYKVFGDPTFV